ncbi:MAG TPA: COX15/CtaA family protein [Gemmatimonadaceae bacterium]|jgi:heme A synthase|nr:COX15/CtaA family protein [Gemmatimonadaceae bacterium]
MLSRSFTRFAWGVLVYNLAVVALGALVRATGSGAGCGSHWPMCNGQLIPSLEHVSTFIEFSHRVTSGIALLLVVALLLWARRLFPKDHAARRAAVFAMAFMISEALVGAVLVLLALVEHDDSVTRTIVLGVHLINTFLLLAGIVLTAWWSAGRPPARLAGHGLLGTVLLVAIVATLVVGVTGALTALGDTLFRPTSLAHGLRQDFSPTAHFLIRLRVLHPVVAVGTAIFAALAALAVAARRPDADTRRLARLVVVLFAAQLAGGLLNVFLMAPVWMQLVHLLMADAVWLALVLLAASALRAPELAERQSGDEPAGQLHPALERA